MVESKTNNSATTTTKNNNANLKHNNSVITNNNIETNNNSAVSNNKIDVNTNSDSKTSVDALAQGYGGGGTLSPHEDAQMSESKHSLNGNKKWTLETSFFTWAMIFLDFVYKSGPLFLSSKGIGWTSWKKRWFVLTQTSLVFFRSDPNVASQRGCEVNLTLGGIDINSSGSVVVKVDKKLLTVLFPDGRDGRAFTLKAETIDDLNEWKDALEEALANAPSASPKVGHNGTLKNENIDIVNGSSEQSNDQPLTTSLVLGRPILLALEDIDGTPSFLEKALRYVEDHGLKVEGILRQAADVEDVERRIQEYEHGKVEFTANEDAHVIGDCIKYVLRELPSSPVPASCCNALLDAYRTDRATRVNAIRTAICDTFPEPNRRLLQRILIMMETVADNKTVNRMSVSAVAACMAPLLLRPLLDGECNLDGQFSMGGGDGSAQLLQAAAAANHAQAIIITLLEEYDNIFGEGDMLSDLYSDSEELGSESEELSEDEIYEDDDEDDGEYSSASSNTDKDFIHASTSRQSGDDRDNPQSHNKGLGHVSHSISHKVTNDLDTEKKVTSSINQSTKKSVEHSENDNVHASTDINSSDNIHRSSTTTDGPPNMQRMTSRRTSVNKKASNINKDAQVERLEATKGELKPEVEAEAKGNSVLKDDLLNKKRAFEVHRLQLEQDVARLEEQVRKELELRKKLETGIKISQQALFSHEKVESDVTSLHKKVSNLEDQYSKPEKLKDSHEATTTSHESKDNKHQFQSYSAKLPPHKQLDPTNNCKQHTYFSKDNSDKQHFYSFSSRLPPSQHSDSTKEMKKSSTTKPKRMNSKNETTGTNSAMSKITNGINFLKERSNQLADELQIMNKDKNKSQSQRHTRKDSQDDLDIQSSMRHKESQLQHLDSHIDREIKTDDQSTNLSMDKLHDESS
ncbi:rho GTPase-activating protein REN1 [Lactuca sativa]|uniref:rho GTPase-activating protein REN1 n=1 Tax=Lactuca sativa TaxID=4236 RepID=UPI0022AEEAEE|nr:rho GTPase-activating protein REN1 [Lactuca sativa]